MVKWAWLVRMNNWSIRLSYKKKTYVYKSKNILLFFVNFSSVLVFFFLLLAFPFLLLLFRFFPLREYVSDQASVIIPETRQWRAKKKERKRWKRESRSPSLVIIILAYFLVLCRQVYSILFFDSQYMSHRKCSNDFFFLEYFMRIHLN